MMKYGIIFSMALVLQLPLCAQQQEKPKTPLSTRVNVVFGVSQLTLGGFNAEANLFYKRLALDYSHGVSLNFSNDMLESGADKDQGLAFHIPWTTGFGVGYRFNEWLNLRVEPKWHRYEMYYDGQPQTPENQITAYTTFTLGLGAYANLRPWGKKENFLKGIMVVPNVRFWPTVSSSLDNNQYEYHNELTGENEVHHAREIGMGNTPFFVNVSVGYSFGL